MKRILLGTVALVALGAINSASAADLPAKAPAYGAPAVPAFTWTGFYVGLYAGYGWGTTTATDAGDSQTPPIPWYVLGGQFSASPDGFIGGGQAGYNYQFGNFVAGVEIDVGYLGLEGSGVFLIPPFDTFVRTSATWDATFRGRFGFAAGPSLFYVTGGAIVANFRSDVKSFGPFITDRTDTQWGWTIGGGWEYAFTPNWSFKVEYLYYDVGSEDVFLNNGTRSRFTIENTGNLARIGVNYRFGGPVVARY